jgi:membrane protein
MAQQSASLKLLVDHVGKTARGYLAANPFEHAASLSYYTLLSLAPLIIVLLAIGGYVFGERTIRDELLRQINALIGPDGAELLRTIMRNARQSEQGVVSTLVGVALTLFGATTVFAELQTALNRIWGVESSPHGALSGLVKARLQAFAMVLGTAFLLLVSLILTAALAALQSALPTAGILWGALDFIASIAFLTVVFAALYKYVPDVEIQWRDTWVGAVVTAVLFSLGKLGIGLYVGRASVGSPYGAAGSVVVLMVWVYYAALVFFFGAVATRMLAGWRGSPIRPSVHAHRIAEQSPG